MMKQMFFDDLIHIRNSTQQFLSSTPKGQEVILFGCGFALTSILEKVESYGFTVLAIGDNNTSKHGQTIHGKYTIRSLAECKQLFPQAHYIIATPSYFEEIYCQLCKEVGHEKVCPVDFECCHYFLGSEFKSFFLANSSFFQSFYERLDPASQTVLYNITKAHFSGERKDFIAAQSTHDDWYLFKSLMQPSKEDVHIDCGAFTGDTVMLFHTNARAGYKHIVAFEPDKKNLPLLYDTIHKNGLDRVIVIEKGAHSCETTLSFSHMGVYSKIPSANATTSTAGTETSQIAVTTIDAVLAERGLQADSIKMDIEGGEYEALKGAQETIQRYTPRLAICLYHNYMDFKRIPELISSFVPEYTFTLKHHSPSCTDTILYAHI